MSDITDTSTRWKSRIVSHGSEAPDQLLAHPLNYRIHPKQQQDALASVLDRVGWVQDIIVNQRTGRVVDGHLRVSLAISEGETSVPVVYVDLDEDEERLILATIDPLSAMATTDAAMLEGLLADVVADGALGDMLTALAGTPDVKEGITDPDDVPEEPEAPYVKRGEVYVLGEHRVMCGDATSAEDVARLLAGERPALMVTDPPYGVEYEGGTKKREALAADGHGTGIYGAFLPVVASVLDPKAPMYVWHADRASMPVLAALAAVKYEVRAQIIWNKNLAQFGALGAQYKQKHEPCFYAHRAGQSPYWYGPTNEVTVWDCARSATNEYHPTQKPVDVIERALTNSSATAASVLDVFLGSGTTLIAAERLGRRCYGMEIEPKYVQVAIERWEQFTGQKAVLQEQEA